MDCSGGRTHGVAGAFQRLMLHALCGFFVALYALAMAPFAYAGGGGGQYIPRGQPIPQGIRYVNATAGGANTSASAMWTDAAGRTTHHKFPVHVSAATLGRLANAAVRRGLPVVGWGLTLKGIVDAAGWVIDELGQQVIDPGREQPVLEPQGWCHYLSNKWTCFNSAVHAINYVDRTFADPLRASGALVGELVTSELGPTSINIVGYHPNGTINNWVIHWRTTTGATNGYPPAIPASPVTDADLGNMIKSQPEVVNAVLIDPETGAPVRTQELTDALNNLRRGLEAANGLPAGDDLDPATDYAAPTPSETEFPEFCHWADVVCDFIEWVKKDEADPDRPDVPIEEIDPTELEQSWSSGMGSGSCPAPYTFEVYGESIAFEYTPICDIVDLLRPFLIAISMVVGACIVAGVRVGKNA